MVLTCAGKMGLWTRKSAAKIGSGYGHLGPGVAHIATGNRATTKGALAEDHPMCRGNHRAVPRRGCCRAHRYNQVEGFGKRSEGAAALASLVWAEIQESSGAVWC